MVRHILVQVPHTSVNCFIALWIEKCEDINIITRGSIPLFPHLATFKPVMTKPVITAR